MCIWLQARASLAEQLGCRIVGLGTLGIALGFKSLSTRPQRPAVVRIEAYRILEVGHGVNQVVLLQIGMAARRVIIGDDVVLGKTLAAAGDRGIGARPELDRLAALRDRGIILLLEIIDGAAVVIGIGVFLVDADGFGKIRQRRVVILFRPSLDAAGQILARQHVSGVMPGVDRARAGLDRGI